ncbi:MAG: rod shape-determining protein MreD [Gammaproteobacteria bacterium]|nr:rod shape-determining protein MreD [Gammaproteobacteria bacterium]
MNPFNGGWVIIVSMIAAMVLAVVHLPETAPQWLGWLRPSWIILVVFYWVMALPHRFGMISAWVTGLLVDVLYADPLGVNGFCLAALTFVTWSFYERFRMYSIAQQCVVVFVMVLGVEAVRMVVQAIARDGGFTWAVLLPALMSILAWPLVAAVLGGVRRQIQVE